MTLTRETAVATARELVPVLAERSAKTEGLRRLPEETLTDFAESGLLRMAQPAAWGGPELPLSAQIDVIAELARGCGSAAWTFAIYASHFWQIALFPEAAQRDVWGADPGALVCTSTVGGPPPERVDGGVHIRDGRWQFVSGVHHADWIAVNAPLPPLADGGPPDMRFLLVPKGDFEIVDDWHAVALAGTGSCTVTLRDVFVPEHRALSFWALVLGQTPGGALHGSPMYRLPLIAAWPSYLAAPAIGIARGAIETWTAKTLKRKHAYSHAPAAEYPVNHVTLGDAAARVDAAHELLRRAADSITAQVAGELPADEPIRVRNRRDFAFATRLCVEAVEKLFLASGASGLADANPIQRHWRDVHGVAAHAMLNLDGNLAGWGRYGLGVSDGLDF